MCVRERERERELVGSEEINGYGTWPWGSISFHLNGHLLLEGEILRLCRLHVMTIMADLIPTPG